MKKKFGPFFLLLSSVINLRKLFIRIHKVFWPLLWILHDHFCDTKEVVENKLKKKANFPVKKSFRPFFSPIIECDKPQTTVYRFPQDNLTITAEVTGIILLHLKSCWKHKFLKKKWILSSEEKILAYFFWQYRVWQISGDSL